MVVEPTEVDWNNIQTALDALNTSDTQVHLITMLDQSLSQFVELVDDNWDYQEVNINDRGEFIGVPIQLALMILNVLKFAAEKDIDIVDAMEKAAKYV
jgi:hypothetical protein